MSAASLLSERPPSAHRETADALYTVAARVCFLAVLSGQWAFLWYVASFYVVTTLRGQFALWHTNPSLLKGYVAGDAAGNLAFAAHVLLAAAVTFGGTLQLVPQIRTQRPALHRWNGRVFVTAAMAGALSGLSMIWLRGARANIVAGIATSLDGLLILAFGVLAWRAARARDFAAHRRWALRTFVVAGGVWFQRIGVFGWTWAFGPVGMTRAFDGWFDLGWNFGCYLLPLAVLEAYLRADAAASPRRRIGVALALFASALCIGFGAWAAVAFVWQPLLNRLPV